MNIIGKKIREYPLLDFLEMHYSNNPKVLERLRVKLLRRPSHVTELHHVPAFAFKDMVVAVQNGEAEKTTQLVVLDPHRQSFRVYQLQPVK